MLDDIIKTAEHKMQRSVDHFKQELQSVRTGRATPGLLDRVQVDYYGTPTPVNALANISTPDPRMIVVQPWDKSLLGPLEKAIQRSDLGITPSNDGQVIRLAVPQPTEERRRELVKQVHRLAEEARVAIRNLRRDAVDHLKKLDKDGQVSSDEAHRAQERVEKLTSSYVHQVDDVAKRKEAEVMEV